MTAAAPATSLTHLFSKALTDPKTARLVEATYPMRDLLSPDMPSPGPSFVAHAIQLGDEIDEKALKKKKLSETGQMLEYLYRRALYDPGFTLPVDHKGETFTANFLPGHLWQTPVVTMHGPKPARVMIVGKFPGREALAAQCALCGRSLAPLFDALQANQVSEADLKEWYVTFACKFGPPTADVTTIPASWFRDSAILFAQELRIVKPDYILCLGAEAAKATLNMKSSVSNLAGRVMTISIPDGDAKHEIKVVAAMHPFVVAKKPEAYADFLSQITRFVDLVRNQLPDNEKVDHGDIYTEEALTALVDEMLADPAPDANIIAVDCEWHGEYPTNPDAYLRTVQVSNKDKWARTIVLRYDGGEVAFRPDLSAARTQLARLLKSTPTRQVRIGGHFFRADLPWLIHFGIDARNEYAPHADEQNRTAGGWDTSLMYHAYNECARYGLDECVLKFTTAPPYWIALEKWRKEYCTKNRIKSEQMGGYGNCPISVLHPYASYDADVTRRIMMKFYGSAGTDGLLAHDGYGNDCWLPYWTAHAASLAFLEMEMTGLVLDRNRADELTEVFISAQENLLAELRHNFNWPNFNPKSHPQMAVALFGIEYASRFAAQVAVPEGARSLNLTPVKTTGKRPTLWHELRQRGDENAKAVPSTDKESLGILGHSNETAAKLRNYKFISQVLQSVLRKPNCNDEGDFEIDDNGNYIYEKGLVGCAHADGKVRTHMFQTKETGRASSSRPPLQNLSKRREADYFRILGSAYQHPVRSVLRVPEGCVGMEADLTGAELAVLAWLAQDHAFIDHVRRNNLPSKHPDHYDIHSQQAVKAFNLVGVAPTKKGLEDAKKLDLRVAAKNVNFGIPYGRGADALVRQCKEEGSDVTVEQCQRMIDAYFESYPSTKDFLAECRARSQDPGWIVGPYGRYRRFVKSDDRAVIGEQQRQAQNFPIQGGVADAVSLALANLYNYRREHPDVEYQITLQIHDAVVLTVPYAHAKRVYEEVLPLCMVERVPFWPRRLDGTLINVPAPYYFGTSRDVFIHWGEELSREDAEKLGFDWLL